MAPRMRTRNGLERLPSGSLKTTESAEKDQRAHECLRQIEEQSTQRQVVTPDKYTVVMQHRWEALRPDKLKLCGSSVPSHNSELIPLSRGVLRWSISSVLRLVGDMKGTRRSTILMKCFTSNSASAPYLRKNTCKEGILCMFYRQWGRGYENSSRTPRNATRDDWELPSCDGPDVFGAHTPATGTKRRCLDPVDPIAFDTKEKLEKATSSVLNLGLPSRMDPQREVDERRKERSQHNEVVEKKKKELETCQDKRASRARVHQECEKACTELETKINDDERRVSKWLSEFPPSLNFAIDTEKYKTPG
ncbi:hypothetical protein FANTH_2771 [Fusarium anthophilum]|uniref:Uncharacterized protein n=1 Tax=Fusarium anthophilum TaxID=48485 RepID=A0A8H5E9K9_9HYPO|nr:hypothetical protein FANTH_2771 [Fusarium anthophilum]